MFFRLPPHSGLTYILLRNIGKLRICGKIQIRQAVITADQRLKRRIMRKIKRRDLIGMTA